MVPAWECICAGVSVGTVGTALFVDASVDSNKLHMKGLWAERV